MTEHLSTSFLNRETLDEYAAMCDLQIKEGMGSVDMFDGYEVRKMLLTITALLDVVDVAREWDVSWQPPETARHALVDWKLHEALVALDRIIGGANPQDYPGERGGYTETGAAPD